MLSLFAYLDQFPFAVLPIDLLLCNTGSPLTRVYSHGAFSRTQGILINRLNGSISRYTEHRSTESGESSHSYLSKFGTIITKTPAPTLDSPVVVILGWNSSRGKHLKKYSEIFEAKNFDSICVPANPINTFFRPGTKVQKIGFHILDLLLELNCQRRPVFLYAFSNGGCAMFFHIMEALSYPTEPFYQAVPVVGTIFDSCPISPDMSSLKATKESVVDMIKNPILKTLVWYSLATFVPPMIYFNGTIKRFMSGLTQSPLKCPQLMLYSKTDKFAPYQDIDSYIQARRDRGINVISKCWDSSEHVNHYREHAEDYLCELNAFIDQCLIRYHNNEGL
ncbi:hypothetical protein ACROYT_G017901 [Oculina patagonica]